MGMTPRCASAIRSIVDSTNRVIPTAQLSRADVLWTYAGVRPLPYEPDVPEAKLTRKHVFHHDEHVRDIISVVGGKLTTHRSLAEGAVDLIFATLGRQAPDCRTAAEPLPGGRAGDWPRFADGFRAGCGLPPEVADHLLDVYGVRAADVLGYAADDESQLARLPGTNAIAAEIPFAVRGEFATTLADIYLRRTMIGLGADLGMDSLEAVTGTAREALGVERGAGKRGGRRLHRARRPARGPRRPPQRHAPIDALGSGAQDLRLHGRHHVPVIPPVR